MGVLETSRRQVLESLGLAGLGVGILGPRRVFAEPAEPSSLAYKNAHLVMPDGQVIQGGIRIEEGRIVDLGAGVQTGQDLGGAWVSPGFVDAGCTVGLIEIDLESGTRDDRIDSEAVTPDARVWDAYNPMSSVIPVTRVEGITHVLVHPSPGRLVSGQAAVFRTVGETVTEAREDGDPLLCINMGRAGMGGGGPSSRMALSMRLREILDEVEVPEEPEEAGRRRGKKDEGEDEDLKGAERIWKAVREARTRVLLKAERADDILRALDLAREYELDAILLGAAEGHRVASELADSQIPVFLGPLTIQPSSFEHLQARYDNAARLHDAGVPLAFRTGNAHSSRSLRVSAGVAVAHGLPWEAAVSALCRGAWAALGRPDAGQLALGSSAHLAITDGDPLQARSPVLRVVIDGLEASMSTRQSELYERFKILGRRVR